MHDLDRALAAELAAEHSTTVAPAVRRLVERYRTAGAVTDRLDPIVGSPADATAYAAYRMPATYAAVCAALRQAPGLTAASVLDLGGGSGAAAWAAAATLPGVEQITVTDRGVDVLATGRRLAARSELPVMRAVTWRQEDLADPAADESTVRGVDLVLVSYVLGELPAELRRAVVERASNATAVLIVEPGTPAGYARVIEARDLLIGAGLTVLAPCPHDRPCPLIPPDWCHLGVRLQRSRLHRLVKDATLGYEDEKFSYVLAQRGAVPAAPGRVIRRPVLPKGRVELQVCRADGEVRATTITRRDGADYRAARDVHWGNAWPPVRAPEEEERHDG